MKKRGDSWLCTAELRTRVGVPRYTSSARLSSRLQQRQDNARCNYICSFDEHVVRLDNMGRARRRLHLTLESARDHVLTDYPTHLWITSANTMTFWEVATA
jgi:hypothetical protein